MAITRVIATLPYFTGVPEDAASNTFYFSSVAEMDATAAGVVASRLDVFYLAIDQLFSSVISTTGGTYRFYRLSDPEPRVPVFTFNMPTLSPASNGSPEEVAACISYFAAPASGEPPARRRGRIYIGPLSVAAVTAASSTSFSNLASATRTTLSNAAVALADQSESAQWSVFSTVDGIARQIVGGWVDNSFDTQRRRGRRATARTTWTGQA